MMMSFPSSTALVTVVLLCSDTSDAAVSFLPRPNRLQNLNLQPVHNNISDGSFLVQSRTRLFDGSTLLALRGGELDEDNNDTQDVTKPTETSSPYQTGEDMTSDTMVGDEILDRESPDSEDHQVDSDDYYLGENYGGWRDDGDTILHERNHVAGAVQQFEEEDTTESDDKGSPDAWEEEIKRLQAFYNSNHRPVSIGTTDSQQSKEMSDTDTADGSNGEDDGVVADEEIEDDSPVLDVSLYSETKLNVDVIDAEDTNTDVVEGHATEPLEDIIAVQHEDTDSFNDDEESEAAIVETALEVKLPINDMDDEVIFQTNDEIEDDVILQIPAATAASATNKLVEEGLRRLRRKDGDIPSIPYVITRAMKRVLVNELGYDEDEVQAMRPDVAVIIVGEKLERPDMAELPSRFYHEDTELNTTLLEERNVKSWIVRMRRSVALLRQLSIRDAITSLVQRCNSKPAILVCTIIAVILSARVGVLPSDREVSIPTQQHAKDLSVDSIVDVDSINSEDEESEAVPEEVELRRDLDQTWLEKLISMLTFHQ